MDDYKIILRALIDKSSLTDIEKQLARKKIEVGVDLDFAETLQNANAEFGKIKSALQKAFNLDDKEAMSFTRQYVKEATALVKQSEKQKQAEIKKTTKQNNSIQSKYYKNIKKEINTLYSLQNKMLNAGKKETAELQKQVKSAKQRLQYNKEQLTKKGLDDNTLTREINNLDAEKKKQLELNQAKQRDIELTRQKKALEQTMKTSNVIGANIDTGKYSTNIVKMQADLQKLGYSSDVVETKLKEVRTAYEALKNSPAGDARIKAEERFQVALAKTQNEVTQLKATYASPIKIANMANSIETWMDKNTKASRDARVELSSYLDTLKQANVSGVQLQNVEQGFKRIQLQERIAGNLGKTFFDTLKKGVGKFSSWGLASGAVMTTVTSLRSAVTELKEIDSILTEISKTSNMTGDELKQLGDDSFEAASKYGRNASDYLTSVQEMNRSGFYGEQGNAMAEQSILAQAAGDMEEEIADKWLLATNAAYKYQGQAEKINAVLDGANGITNRNSVNMTDMAEAMSTVGTAASQAGIEVNELSSLVGTAVATTKKDGNEIGTALKSIIVNMTNVSSSKITGTLDKANASMTEMKNGIEQMRDPIDVLKDLAKTYNSLDAKDPLKSEITTNIASKRQANILAAILTNIDQYEKMLGDYSEGTGSAAEEAEKSANNWEGSLNRLSNTWTDFVQNFADSDLITGAVNGLNSLVSAFEKITSGNAIETVGVALGGILGAKNIGKTQGNCFQLPICPSHLNLYSVI